MEVKTFEQEVAETKKNISEQHNAEIIKQSYIENETELAVIFNQALKYGGEMYISDRNIAGMIGSYFDYRSNRGFGHKQAIIASIWNYYRWTTASSESIERTIEQTLDFDPSRRVSQIRFSKKHRSMLGWAYTLSCVVVYAIAYFAIMLVLQIPYLALLFSLWFVWLYMLFTMKYLNKENY